MKNFTYADSPLSKDSQISSINLMSDGKGFGIGSIDGRANLTSLTTDYSGAYKHNSIMTFKCH